MKAEGQLLFLGTGGSMGVPVIGCSCDVCTSPSHYNKRRRSSVLLTVADQRLLVDCGPDFRDQALTFGIKELDGVILTHAHNDHIAGIDDLKVYCLHSGRPLPCLLSPETEKDLRIRYGYLFEEREPYAGMMTRFGMQQLERKRGNVVFQGVYISYFSYQQLQMRVDGYRLGDIAYVSDIKDYSPTILEDLKGVRTLVLSALRFKPSPMHFTVDEAVEFSRQVGAEKTWLMHVAHEMDHAAANAYLPKNVRLAYDGLQIGFEAEVVNGNI
ncbi:MAG: MBL fold metallo-hydrolase [Parachlamydiaceae bacterium]